MFPRLRTQFLGRLDRLLELGTLGSYGVAEDGRALALDLDGAPAAARSRDVCPYRETGLSRPALVRERAAHR